MRTKMYRNTDAKIKKIIDEIEYISYAMVDADFDEYENLLHARDLLEAELERLEYSEDTRSKGKYDDE